ncbi:hypothetical protein NA57DRAFT_76928 [Rhizodiscina lignyota]|uniref:F-box domain-containing protein n=1 Tax=Rhizodiscina lignyota TaxID=1504668 RepID=A0A9P4IDQ2_9PEZI|nr:hypothetical protein NA57DRAFT_76928 [Rhizodiscina lignyota]
MSPPHSGTQYLTSTLPLKVSLQDLPPELLELIFLHVGALSILQLVKLRAVSQHWHDIIQYSPTLQRQLFLQTDGREKSGSMLTLHVSGQTLLSPASQPVNSPGPSNNQTSILFNPLLQHFGLRTTPNVERTKENVDNTTSHHNTFVRHGDWAFKVTRNLENPQGLTIGDLDDCLEKMTQTNEDDDEMFLVVPGRHMLAFQAYWMIFVFLNTIFAINDLFRKGSISSLFRILSLYRHASSPMGHCGLGVSGMTMGATVFRGNTTIPDDLRSLLRGWCSSQSLFAVYPLHLLACYLIIFYTWVQVPKT